MKPKVALRVEIDLDALPGANYHGEDAQRWLQYTLDHSIPHYHPRVTIISNDRPVFELPELEDLDDEALEMLQPTE